VRWLIHLVIILLLLIYFNIFVAFDRGITMMPIVPVDFTLLITCWWYYYTRTGGVVGIWWCCYYDTWLHWYITDILQYQCYTNSFTTRVEEGIVVFDWYDTPLCLLLMMKVLRYIDVAFVIVYRWCSITPIWCLILTWYVMGMMMHFIVIVTVLCIVVVTWPVVVLTLMTIHFGRYWVLF